MLSCSKEIKDILLKLRWYFVDAIKPALEGQRDLYKSRKGSPILKWTIFPRVFLIFNELKKNLMKHQIYLRPFERETSPLPGQFLPNFRQTLPEVHELQRNSADYFPAVSVICLQILHTFLTNQEQKLNHARLGREFLRVFLRLELWSLHTVSFH